MDNTELMTTWCRMWSEDPALAREVMTDDCVQWSGQTPGLDTVVGPEQQEKFVTGYRAQHVNVFQPRVLVDGGDRFAYLWDVTRPDGSITTGIDVNMVREGRIAENWTFVAAHRCDEPDPQTGGSLDGVGLAEQWLQLQNGQRGADHALVTDDVTVFVGESQAIRGSAPLAAHLDAVRAAYPPLAGELHRQPVVDAASGRIALLRTTTDADGRAGGVDLLAVRDGRIAQVWSLSGTRPFRY